MIPPDLIVFIVTEFDQGSVVFDWALIILIMYTNFELSYRFKDKTK